MKWQISRRDFLKEASAYTVLAGGAIRFNHLISSASARIAVVGLGDSGQRFLRILTAIEGVEVVALCDRRNDRLKTTAISLPGRQIPAQYENAYELLDHSDAAGLVLTVPEPEQRPFLSKAVHQGKVVLLERPGDQGHALMEEVGRGNGRVVHANPVGVDEAVRIKLSNCMRKLRGITQVRVHSWICWPSPVHTESEYRRVLVDQFADGLMKCLPAFHTVDCHLTVFSYSPKNGRFQGPWLLRLDSEDRNDPIALVEVHARNTGEDSESSASTVRYETDKGSIEWGLNSQSAMAKAVAGFIAQTFPAATYLNRNLLREQYKARALAMTAVQEAM